MINSSLNKVNKMSSPTHPLVSCIMPTYNRRHFVARAIEYFLRQDYEPKELIVVDDGDHLMADLMPDHPRVRYIRLERRLTVGAKRNLACEHTTGEIIPHGDDEN
jgi:glycosyltransferase involved in cell wall biosynthesis